MENTTDDQLLLMERMTRPHEQRGTRAAQYRRVLKAADVLYAGRMLFKHTFEGHRNKDKETRIFYVSPADDGIITINVIGVYFRDPGAVTLSCAPIAVTKHAVERLAQRAGAHPELDPLKYVVGFWTTLPAPGKYAVGCDTGLAIVVVEKDMKTAVVTFIDKEKLREDQSATVGENRRIK
jgi:hypothetical protein